MIDEMTDEMTDEMILWGSVIFVSIILSDSNIYTIPVLFTVLCLCLGTDYKI